MRSIVLAAVAGLTATPAMAQGNAPAPKFADMSTVSVSAEGRVERAPDVAEITAGVTTEAPAAGEAMQANARQMTAVVAAIKKSGIADRDVQTSGLNLQPQYVYKEGEPPRLTGYRVSNNVQVRLRELAEAGKVIDALVAEGANQISGPDFRLDDPDPALDEARQEAMRKARARAELYAKAAGLRVGRVLQISEDGRSYTPPPAPMMRMETGFSDSPTPVAPGQLELTSSVSVTYALE